MTLAPAMPSLIEAWSNHHLAEERQIFGIVPWCTGSKRIATSLIGFCSTATQRE
jgi:hypothetical protein